jgi:ribonuclease HI
MTHQIVIHFDGGTPCNIPAKGYGIGYGSYSFNGGTPVRVNHGIPCSNNAAEILTLARALQHLSEINKTPEQDRACHVHIVGDSQIALKWAQVCAGTWAKPKTADKQLRKGAPGFQKAVNNLRSAICVFRHVTTEWKGREHAVAAFGH